VVDSNEHAYETSIIDSNLNFEYYNFTIYGHIQRTVLPFENQKFSYHILSIVSPTSTSSNISYTAQRSNRDLYEIILDNVILNCKTTGQPKAYFLSLLNVARVYASSSTYNFTIQGAPSLYASSKDQFV
jgi:hypothetical protein